MPLPALTVPLPLSTLSLPMPVSSIALLVSKLLPLVSSLHPQITISTDSAPPTNMDILLQVALSSDNSSDSSSSKNAPAPIAKPVIPAAASIPTHKAPAPKPASKKPYKPSQSSTTARGLCAIVWARTNPESDKNDFKAYWDDLGEEGQKFWKDRERKAKDAAAAALAA
ncbi:hypothetical protein FB45DRAFT_1108750 [Roridomyces roridus]|uniref:Uncharacterized protein n=1 Tax=Roridomyces roridus TaxID=1738132 RepID=A0AAD7AXA2_9AGAR|nr:hypothetical protein FB45DRAFT_1108750 [Roridomyces roridus]